MRPWPIIGVALLLLGCGPAASTPSAPTPMPRSTHAPAPTGSPTPAGSTSGVPGPALFGNAWDDRGAFRSGLVAAEQAVLDSDPGASVYHLALTVSDDLGTVSGRQEVRYTNTESVPLDEVRFRLFPNLLGGAMTVGGLAVNGQEVKPSYEMQSSVMVVPLPEPLQPGEQAVLSLQFQVDVPDSLDQNYGVLSSGEGVLAYAHGYPMISVFDDSGWNAEIPPDWADMTFGDASYYLVRVSAPDDLLIVTSGSEISREGEAGRQEIVLAAGPARDFFLVASPDYEVTARKHGEVTLRALTRPDYQERVALALDAADAALSAFEARYGPYPYTELDLAVTPTYALGIEYPGIIALNQRMFTPEQDLSVAPEESWLDSTVAHEVAHQWFYNLVGNDQLDQPWLDEALSQFATWEYYADERGLSAARAFQDTLEGRWSRVEGEPMPLGLPAADYAPPAYGAIIYGRGPLFLAALRDQMGVETFDGFMRDYVDSHRWGIATTEGFRTLAERHCDCDLGPLFEAWVYP